MSNRSCSSSGSRGDNSRGRRREEEPCHFRKESSRERRRTCDRDSHRSGRDSGGSKMERKRKCEGRGDRNSRGSEDRGSSSSSVRDRRRWNSRSAYDTDRSSGREGRSFRGAGRHESRRLHRRSRSPRDRGRRQVSRSRTGSRQHRSPKLAKTERSEGELSPSPISDDEKDRKSDGHGRRHGHHEKSKAKVEVPLTPAKKPLSDDNRSPPGKKLKSSKVDDQRSKSNSKDRTHQNMKRTTKNDEKKEKEDKPPKKTRTHSREERKSNLNLKLSDPRKKSVLKKKESHSSPPTPPYSPHTPTDPPPPSPHTPPYSPHTPTYPPPPSPHTPPYPPPVNPSKITKGEEKQGEKKKSRGKNSGKRRVRFAGETRGNLNDTQFFANLVRDLHGPMSLAEYLPSHISPIQMEEENVVTSQAAPKPIEVLVPKKSESQESLSSLLELSFPPGTDQWVNDNKLPALMLMPPPAAPVTTSIGSKTFTRPKVQGRNKAAVLEWGDRSINSYKVSSKVGQGTFGKVYKAMDMICGGLVALKKMRMFNEAEGFPLACIREIKILRQLKHKNIISLREIVTDKKDAREFGKKGNCYLVFEYVPHDLWAVLASGLVTFSQEHISSVMKQLLDGLNYCHKNNVMHRDIKPTNILINNKGEIKLADFGLARFWDSAVKRPYTNKVITLWYRPPEILLGLESYTPAVDVWSVGCIMAELFYKRAILVSYDEMTQLQIIFDLCGSPEPEVWPSVVDLPLYSTVQLKKENKRRVKEKFKICMPPPALDLLDKMLILDPDQRITAEEALKSEWLVNVDPGKIKPPKFPLFQDCHELWVTNRHKKLSTEPYQMTPSPIPNLDPSPIPAAEPVRYPIPAMYPNPNS